MYRAPPPIDGPFRSIQILIVAPSPHLSDKGKERKGKEMGLRNRACRLECNVGRMTETGEPTIKESPPVFCPNLCLLLFEGTIFGENPIFQFQFFIHCFWNPFFVHHTSCPWSIRGRSTFDGSFNALGGGRFFCGFISGFILFIYGYLNGH